MCRINAEEIEERYSIPPAQKEKSTSQNCHHRKNIDHKINEKIIALEMMYEQTEEGMRNAETEKARNSMEAKLNAIRYKIDELKRQSDLIKVQIESKNNNKNIN